MTSNTDVVIQSGLQLLARAESLRSFRDAQIWIGDARQAANRVEGVIATLDQHFAQVEVQATAAIVAHRKESFLRRIFSKPDGANERAKWRDLAVLRRSQSKQLVSELLSMCDCLPTSSAEQKSALTELRLKKKELSQMNRAIGAEIREVRLDARQARANVGTGIEILSGGRYRRFRHMAIRSGEVGRLVPHEQHRSRITSEIAEVERAIIRLERFQ